MRIDDGTVYGYRHGLEVKPHGQGDKKAGVLLRELRRKAPSSGERKEAQVKDAAGVNPGGQYMDSVAKLAKARKSPCPGKVSTSAGAVRVRIPSESTALKFDSDKLPYDLLPVRPLESVVNVLRHGAKKYAVRNWEKGFRHGRVYAAAQRHLNQYWGGEDLDQETGEFHLAHVVCCLLFLLEFQFSRAGEDDRPSVAVKRYVHPDGSMIKFTLRPKEVVHASKRDRARRR